MATYQEIQQQIEKLKAQAEQLREAELAGIITELKAKIQQYGLTAVQLGLVATRGSRKKNAGGNGKAVPQYRNESGETWTGAGRGRKPAWVKAILDAGGDIEKYRI